MLSKAKSRTLTGLNFEWADALAVANVFVRDRHYSASGGEDWCSQNYFLAGLIDTDKRPIIAMIANNRKIEPDTIASATRNFEPCINIRVSKLPSEMRPAELKTISEASACNFCFFIFKKRAV